MANRIAAAFLAGSICTASRVKNGLILKMKEETVPVNANSAAGDTSSPFRLQHLN